MTTTLLPLEQTILTKIQLSFQPTHIELVNESENHSRPRSAESHFYLILVSQAFEGLSRVERQRRVHSILKEELADGVHALSLRLYSPNEWAESPKPAATPDCLHGRQRMDNGE